MTSIDSKTTLNEVYKIRLHHFSYKIKRKLYYYNQKILSCLNYKKQIIDKT